MSASTDTRRPVPPQSPETRNPRLRASIPIQHRSRRAERRRILAWGLGISALLHLLLLLFASRAWLPIAEPGLPAAPQAGPARRTLPEMQALNLRVTDDAAPLPAEESPEAPAEERPPPRRTEEPEEPAARTERTPPAPTAEPGERPDAPAGRTVAPASPAERLSPGFVDPRLWGRAEAPPPPVKSDLDIARERVYARLEMLNDSAAAEAAAASRATDWTFTDKDGKKWGISPGKVHLGGVTLPLPIGFSPPPDQAREARERASRAGEIKDHADRARVRGSFEEQRKATREQRDRDRAAKRDTTKAGGTE